MIAGLLKGISVAPWAVTLAMVLSGTGAKAAESIAVAGPIGGSDIGAGFLPQDGLWISGVAASVGFTDYFDNDGKRLDADGSDNIAGVGVLYVYPGDYWGGKLGSTLFLGAERLCFSVASGSENCSSGRKDIYSDVLMWSRYFPSAEAANQTPGRPYRPFGTSVLLGLGVTFPTGKFDTGSVMNNGANFWGFSPNIALTHTVSSPLPAVFGDSLEVSGRFFYHKYTENEDTSYETGSVASLDWAVTLAKNNWKYGLSGLTYKQLEDDKIAGVVHPNDGNRSSVFGIGPIISYDFMSGDRPVNLMVKGIHSLWGENVVASTGVFVRLSTKF